LQPPVDLQETGGVSAVAVRSSETVELVAGMRVVRYGVSLEDVPVDFFADPDGAWDFAGLVHAAGFRMDEGVAVGALAAPYRDHPEGAAVVTLNAKARPYVAIVECPVAVTLGLGPVRAGAAA
jgi:hypothetical protein